MWLAFDHVKLFLVISATWFSCYKQCLGRRSKYSNTQNYSVARAIGRMGIVCNTLKLFIRLQIVAGLSGVIAASSTQLIPIFRVGDPPGLVLNGKHPWLTRMT